MSRDLSLSQVAPPSPALSSGSGSGSGSGRLPPLEVPLSPPSLPAAAAAEDAAAAPAPAVTEESAVRLSREGAGSRKRGGEGVVSGSPAAAGGAAAEGKRARSRSRSSRVDVDEGGNVTEGTDKEDAEMGLTASKRQAGDGREAPTDLSASSVQLTWRLLRDNIGGMTEVQAKQLLEQLKTADLRTVGDLYVEAELVRVDAASGNFAAGGKLSGVDPGFLGRIRAFRTRNPPPSQAGAAPAAAAAPPPAPALNRAANEPLDSVVKSVLGGFPFPDPSSVALEPMAVGRLPASRLFAHQLAAAGVPRVPGVEAEEPYLLMHGWGAPLSAEEDARVRAFIGKSNVGPVVVFAASGMGKTRFLLRVLRDHAGSYFVHRRDGADSDKPGSRDLGAVAQLIDSDVKALLAGGPDRERARGFAETGLRCVFVARLAFKAAWEAACASMGKAAPTPAQWALAQLHPEIFLRDPRFPNEDTLMRLAKAVYRRASDATVMAVEAPGGYRTMIDEAQNLNAVLPKTFPSAMLPGTRPESYRSLLECAARAVYLTGGFVILSGTGLSMKLAIKAAESGTGTLDERAKRAQFDDFTPFGVTDVAALMQSVGLAGPFPAPVTSLLQGRPRFAASFIDALAGADAGVGAADQTMLDVLARFHLSMTDPTGDPRTTAGGIVRKMRDDTRLQSTPVSLPPRVLGLPAVMQGAFFELQLAAWSLINGRGALLKKSVVEGLIETGVALDYKDRGEAVDEVGEMVPLRLEPLFLQAFKRLSLLQDGFLGARLTSQVGLASSMGFTFEDIVGVKLVPSLFPVDGVVPIEQHAAFAGVPGSLPARLKGVWRAFPAPLGQVTEPGGNALAWFARMLPLVRDPVSSRWFVVGKAPGVHAGPDYMAFVRRWEMRGGAWVATDDIAVVLVQAKLAVHFDLEKALLTTDPKLVYHIRRTTRPKVLKCRAEAYREFRESLKGVGVFRIVVSAAEGGDVGATVSTVAHGREGSAFPEDARIVLRGPGALNAVFGTDLRAVFEAVKRAPVCDDENPALNEDAAVKDEDET